MNELEPRGEGLCTGCSCARDATRDQVLLLISTLRFLPVNPKPLDSAKDQNLRLCRMCGTVYFPRVRG